jgi:3-hydroxyisobutyrate dehydrogenase
MNVSLGFIGLGRMGRPMAAALRGAGYPVTAYDASPRARSEDPGSVDTLAEVSGDVVILMLPNSQVVESVVEDLLDSPGLRVGSLVVDMGSSDPRSTRALGHRLATAGVSYVDAPVSGGVARAAQATLTIMAGGAAADVERARPVLTAMGRPTHVGTLGAGHAIKACNNVLAGISLLAAVEVLETVKAFGIDPAVAFDVINTSTGRSWSTEHKIPTFVLPEDYRSGFALDLLVKDIGIANDLADDLGVEHALLGTALDLWRRAGNDLPAAADHTAIAEWAARQGRPVETGADT